MSNWLRAVAYFLLSFVLMLVAFWALWAFLTINGVDINGNWIYILFALQQVVTLLAIWWSMKMWWWMNIESILEYFRERFMRKGRGLFWKRVVGWFIFYMLANGLLFMLVEAMWRTIPWLYGDQSVMVMLEEMNLTWAIDWILTVLMVVIIWPVVEELVYRGLITDALMQKRRWWWVVLAAFIFALIHLEFAVFRNLFMLALILWVIYKKTWSMRYSFLFHVIINGMGITALWVQESRVLEQFESV